jgi:hypothetical protein
MASSLNSPTPQERWHRFTAATVRAFHRYATWLVSLSWWRFGWYALVLIIVTGLVQKLPPFSLTYYETIVDSATHRKAKSRMPAPPAPPSAPAMPEHPAHPEKPEQPEKPETPSPSPRPDAKADDSKSVDIKLPGIIVNTKDHSVKNKGVNITFTGDGIHISSDDGQDDAKPAANAASAAASAVQAAKVLEAATAAKAAATTAKERADAARFEAAAKRDLALAKAMEDKAAAEQARAAHLGDTAAQAAAQAASAASAAVAAASQAAVDIVVGGQHVRIDVPAHASADDVREAVEQARSTIVEQIQDAEEKHRAAEQEAADRATETADKAKQHDDDADDDGDGDSSDKHRTMHARTINTVPLSMLAVWWILGSMLIKITYKGRMQAEVKAAEATETAEAESLRRQVLEARMAMMQAQVEPHFLFNTLASIDHLIEFDPKRASQMQRNLISLLRASMPSMRSTDSGLRPLDLELAVVRPYLEILKVRMEERLTTEIDVPDGLLSAEFPPMMIQTLVENSIKHGLEPKAEGGHLSVKAEIRHGKLAVTVCDTGLGFEAAAQGSTHGTGVGLANIRERLALLYGSKASLTIANNPVGGTIVTITVPYTTHTESDSDEGAKA